MINFLVTSTLLSLVGWLLYMLLVRRFGSAFHQKIFIYAVIVCSLLMPALLTQAFDQKTLLPSKEVAGAFGQQFHGTDMHLKHFCNCQNPNISHRILYRTNSIYNLLIDHKSWWVGAILIAMFLVIIRIGFQYLYLFQLLKKSKKEELQLFGKKYTLLHTPKAHAIGAFQLGKAYIIWQEELSALSDKELQAVFAHELSHLQQRNTLEKAILSLIQCLWLLNPAFYFFRKELDLISEYIADKKGCESLGNPKIYAQLLVQLKSLQATPLVAHLTANGRLHIRIKRLLSNSKGHWAAPLLALCLLIAFQFMSVRTLSAQVDEGLQSLETYEEIYQHYPQQDELLYCPDCETACTPDED